MSGLPGFGEPPAGNLGQFAQFVGVKKIGSRPSARSIAWMKPAWASGSVGEKGWRVVGRPGPLRVCPFGRRLHVVRLLRDRREDLRSPRGGPCSSATSNRMISPVLTPRETRFATCVGVTDTGLASIVSPCLKSACAASNYPTRPSFNRRARMGSAATGRRERRARWHRRPSRRRPQGDREDRRTRRGDL